MCGETHSSLQPSILSINENDIHSLSEEGKVLVSTIVKAMQENKVLQIGNQFDEVNQYEA